MYMFCYLLLILFLDFNLPYLCTSRIRRVPILATSSHTHTHNETSQNHQLPALCEQSPTMLAHRTTNVLSKLSTFGMVVDSQGTNDTTTV
eukprot:m.241184 g.241184  ORF g.241184 m.241184 type:complete len:90 (+) comp33770_c2_seq1:156-425(+)